MVNDTFVSLGDALSRFVESTQHQSQEHIRSLHWHIACRLVIEGGFHPTWIRPIPPLAVETKGSGANRRHMLHLDEDAAHSGEQTILGGLKTKSVDVVVSTELLGPALAVSVKGSLNAFRNLTNRMEEAAGDCTNLHLTYPTLVYGFLHVVRANREHTVEKRNDIAVFANGEISEDVKRYNTSMKRLTGRSDVRNEASRYESVAIALIGTDDENSGEVMDVFPPTESPLRFERFFEVLYENYDLRFVYAAPALKTKTARLEWDPQSPVVVQSQGLGFQPRLANA